MKSCPRHPGYRGVRSPIPTELNPQGCPQCWRIFAQSMARTARKLDTEDVKLILSSFGKELRRRKNIQKTNEAWTGNEGLESSLRASLKGSSDG